MADNKHPTHCHLAIAMAPLKQSRFLYAILTNERNPERDGL